jgi:hypothetical protein
MARKTITRLEDDTDGSEASETVEFAIDGVSYAIDLSTKNAEKLRTGLGQYISAARKVGGRAHRSAKATFSGVDNHAVRAWAQTRGIEVSSRGRIAADVVEKFHAAGN